MVNPFTKKYSLKEDWPYTLSLKTLQNTPQIIAEKLTIVDGISDKQSYNRVPRGVWVLPNADKKCLFVFSEIYCNNMGLNKTFADGAYCYKLKDMLSYNSERYDSIYYLEEWPYKEKIQTAYVLDNRMDTFKIIPYTEEDWKD